MNTNDINAQVAVRGHRLSVWCYWSQVYQKLQIIIVWGVFTVFVIRRLLFVADIFIVWKKNLEICSESPHPRNEAFSLKWYFRPLIISLPCTWTSFLAIMNSHSFSLSSSPHCHLSPPSFCWLEWFIHISCTVSWWNVNNVRVPETAGWSHLNTPGAHFLSLLLIICLFILLKKKSLH